MVTFFSVITPVRSIGTGGRGLFLKSGEPHPVISTTVAPTARIAGAPPRNPRVFRVALIPPAPTLTEPDRFSRAKQAVEFPLDSYSYVLGERLHEPDVPGVLGPVTRKIDGLQKSDLELGGQVHRGRRESEVRESVVDREVDETGNALEQGNVRKDRHRLLGPHHGYGHDRHAGADGGAHEAAPAEAAQAVALPEELAASLLTFGEHKSKLSLVAQKPLGVGRVGGNQADLVGQHAHAGIALEPVLAEHVERARLAPAAARVLVSDRLHDHRGVWWERPGMVRHEQRAAFRRHVLNPFLL